MNDLFQYRCIETDEYQNQVFFEPMNMSILRFTSEGRAKAVVGILNEGLNDLSKLRGLMFAFGVSKDRRDACMARLKAA